MSDDGQYQLALIGHAYGGELIPQRQANGYINATAMCKAAGKAWADYNRLTSTKAFLRELATEVGIPMSELIQSVSGGHPDFQGTWVHPQVAIHLAQWLSPKFAVRVSQWVYDWMSGQPPEERLWRRFQDRIALTHDSVPVGYFGIFKESADLYATLIIAGANLGARMLLDISIGQHWAKYWRSNDLARRYGAHREYEHSYPSYYPQSASNPQRPCCYPEDALPEFRRWMREVYSPKKLPLYLKSQVAQRKMLRGVAEATLLAIESHQARKRVA